MTPKEAYYLAVDDLVKFSEMKDYYESIIATDCWYSFIYATNILNNYFTGKTSIINNRFERGEYIISKNRPWFRSYIKGVNNSNMVKNSFYYKFI